MCHLFQRTLSKTLLLDCLVTALEKQLVDAWAWWAKDMAHQGRWQVEDIAHKDIWDQYEESQDQSKEAWDQADREFWA